MISSFHIWSQNFYVGLDYNAQHTYMAPELSAGFIPFLIIDDDVSVVNKNHGFGGHGGMYLGRKYFIETGLRLTKESDGRQYDFSDTSAGALIYMHEEYSHLRIPLYLGWSTNPDKNFRFKMKFGIQTSLLTNADNYIYVSTDEYYENNMPSDLLPRDYIKTNAKNDDRFDGFLSYDEYFGLSGKTMSKFRRLNLYYHVSLGFEFTLHPQIRAGMNFYTNAGLYRMHNEDYQAGPYNFWRQVFSMSTDDQMHRNKNFGALFNVSYYFKSVRHED